MGDIHTHHSARTNDGHHSYVVRNLPAMRPDLSIFRSTHSIGPARFLQSFEKIYNEQAMPENRHDRHKHPSDPRCCISWPVQALGFFTAFLGSKRIGLE